VQRLPGRRGGGALGAGKGGGEQLRPDPPLDLQPFGMSNPRIRW
jgi:hypothetical protein